MFTGPPAEVGTGTRGESGVAEEDIAVAGTLEGVSNIRTPDSASELPPEYVQLWVPMERIEDVSRLVNQQGIPISLQEALVVTPMTAETAKFLKPSAYNKRPTKPGRRERQEKNKELMACKENESNMEFFSSDDLMEQLKKEQLKKEKESSMEFHSLKDRKEQLEKDNKDLTNCLCLETEKRNVAELNLQQTAKQKAGCVAAAAIVILGFALWCFCSEVFAPGAASKVSRSGIESCSAEGHDASEDAAMTVAGELAFCHKHARHLQHELDFCIEGNPWHTINPVKEFAKNCNMTLEDVNSKRSLLHLAARSGLADVTFMLLANKSFTAVNSLDSDGCTALHYAAWNGHADVTSLLLSSDAFTAVNTVGIEGSGTALHQAARGGHIDVVSRLLSSAAFTAVNMPDEDGATALHMAAWQGHAGVAAALLAHDRFTAQSARKNDNATALDLARWFNHSSVAEIIAEALYETSGTTLVRTQATADA